MTVSDISLKLGRITGNSHDSSMNKLLFYMLYNLKEKNLNEYIEKFEIRRENTCPF